MSRKKSALTMYYTVNTAFMHYFDSLKENLERTNLDAYIPQKCTTQVQVLPISLQTTQLDSKLLKAPETLKDLVQQYRQKEQVLNKVNGNNSETKRTFLIIL